MAGKYAGVALPTEPARIQRDNKLAWNQVRSLDDAHFFTIGYMGRSREQFLAVLQSAGVASVVDIRANAVSMYKPEFSKRNLMEFLREAGIEYQHLPHLGVPRHVRSIAAEQESRDLIWDWYDTNALEGGSGPNLHWFCNVLEHPVALMCVELDPTACHRHRLALALEGQRLQSFDL